MRAAILATLLVGCSSGDSLVVVTVDANPALANVALLHTTSMAGGQTIVQDVGSTAAPFAVGGGTTKTFGVQVQSAITGSFMIHVEAQDASGKKLAQGDGSTTLSPGQRVDVAVTLTPSTPPIVAQPFWIGSGGATATLGINIGGSDTVGTSTAASGAAFQSSFFPIQTY
jgi:hypothetical protein